MTAIILVPSAAPSVVYRADAAANAAHPVAARTSAAITWKVDHPAQTITVTVRIAVFVATAPRGPLGQKALLDAVGRIEAEIRSKWSDLMFKCYKFVVDPQVRLASSRSEVTDDEFPVQLDTAIYPAGPAVNGSKGPGSTAVRSHVKSTRGGSDYLSDTPGTDFDVPTGPDASVWSVWAFYAGPGTYAHEFGHLLGLLDNYDERDGNVNLPGTPRDVMFNGSRPPSPETITKVIRIGGQVDESTIKCPFSIDLADTQIGIPTGVAGTAGGTLGFHAWACDYDPPSSDPARRKPISMMILFRGFGGADAGPFGSVDGGGVSMYTSSIPPPEVMGVSSFKFDTGTGLSFDTPVRWSTRSGLVVGGQTVVSVDGGSLGIGRAVATQGAPECQ